MVKKYNSRFNRPSKSIIVLIKFRLTSRDIELIRLTAQFRFIDTNHYHNLLGGSIVRMRLRLKMLWILGYLDRPKIQIDYYIRGGGSSPMIYAITKNGAKLLLEHGHNMPGLYGDWLTKNKNVKHPFMQHQLMITNFVVKLKTATSKIKKLDLFDYMNLTTRLPVKTAELAKPFRLKTHVMINSRSYEITLEPDYSFALQCGNKNKRGFFFCEMDRGTMPIERSDFNQTSIIKKMLAYQTYWRVQKAQN